MEIWKDSYKIQDGSCFWGVRDKNKTGKRRQGECQLFWKGLFLLIKNKGQGLPWWHSG